MGQNRLGIGFIGGGFITRFHIQSLVGVRDADVIGIVSRTKASAEESATLARTIGVGNNAKEGAYLRVNGIQMYYEKYGDGEPLLLLHGGSSSMHDFKYLIP